MDGMDVKRMRLVSGVSESESESESEHSVGTPRMREISLRRTAECPFLVILSTASLTKGCYSLEWDVTRTFSRSFTDARSSTSICKHLLTKSLKSDDQEDDVKEGGSLKHTFSIT